MNSFASRLKDISTTRVSGKAAFGKRSWAKISDFARDGLCSLLTLLLVPVQAVFGVTGYRPYMAIESIGICRLYIAGHRP